MRSVPPIFPLCINAMALSFDRGRRRGFSMIHSTVRAPIYVGALCGAIGVGTALLLGAAAVLISPTSVNAKAEFAAQTGLPCGQCHSNPAGGGKLKAFGEKFKANGFKVKK
jgi:hypothetical protein